MTTEEIEESQSGIEDGGMGGPGAPTPLSALEVPSSVAGSSILMLIYDGDRVLQVLRRGIFN